MSPVPRPMRPNEEAGVRKLFESCHPTWAPKPPGYFTAFPTLVLTRGTKVIGSTSFFLSYPPPALMPDPAGFVMWGHGVSVHPEHRGEGLGLQLCDARLELAQRLGMKFFIGMTWASNKPMIRLFEKLDHTLSDARMAHAFPENQPADRDGLMYTRGV